MVRAGLSPLQALTVATRNGAVLLHADRETGTLQVGKMASFIVLEKDPSADIRNTRTIRAVFQAHHRPPLQHRDPLFIQVLINSRANIPRR